MSRFNSKTAVNNKTTNLAGGEAYKESPKLKLVSLLLTSFVQEQYYRSAKDGVAQLGALIDTIADKDFIAKAGIYARNEFGMRSISHVLAGELAARVKGAPWSRSFYDKIVRRPDDITEILAYYMATHGKPLPNAMKRGLAQSFSKFDAYQLAKYRGEGNAISLVDAVNLVHPKPGEKNEDALKALVTGTLKSTGTWESKLSAAGKSEDADQAKAEAWKALLSERKLGYFALLRNLRNIIEQSPEMVDLACEMLVDEKLIRKSLVLPFRYMAAYKELLNLNNAGARKAIVAIDKALAISFSNIPELDGETLVVVDHSGSMETKMSNNSTMNLFEIGALFGVALAKSQNADFMYFGDIAKYFNISPTAGVLDTLNFLNGCNAGWYGDGEYRVGHGTNFPAIFETANKKYDRVLIFSDMQAWVGGYSPARAFAEYKELHGVDDCKVYSIDLAGYGSLQFPERNVYAIAGFSEKLFNVMGLLEQDKEALIHEIESVEL